MKFGLCSLTWISPFATKNVDLFQKAADMGFDLFECSVEQVEVMDCAQIIKAAKAAKIDLALGGAFGPTRDMSSEDPEIRENGKQYVFTLLDMARAMECEYIMGPIYSAVGKARQTTEQQRQDAWQWAVDNIRACAEHAAKYGIRMAIEPLNRFETDFINTTEQALELLRRIGMDNVGITSDTFHMGIEEKNIPAAIRKAGDRIFNFHACANDRGTPGEDNFNWPEIVRALKDVGYDGPVVIESFTPDCVEIAKAASVWRPFAESQDALAQNGVNFLRKAFV